MMTENGCPKTSDETMAAAEATRQRKKRKWDQPAESVISAGPAVPGALPLGMAGLPGMTLPVVALVPGSLPMNPIPAACLTTTELLQAPAIQQGAAAIIQKLNQPKIQDELIAREIVINDAESTVRCKLTKRQTQEEIQRCTGAVVITRGKYRPPNGLPDNEKPLYLHISAGAHLKDTAERVKAVDRAASMVEEIMKQGQGSQSASVPFHSILNSGLQVPLPLSTSVFLGFDMDPSLNIAVRIRGPNDQYINHIMNETGATVILRGRGSGNLESSHAAEAERPLHLYLSSNNQQSLDNARILAENLLDTICAECGASRISSCKAYNAVPPPQQLLAGVQSSGNEMDVNASPIVGPTCSPIGSTLATSLLTPISSTSSSSNICPPGTTLPHGGMFNYGQPQGNIVSYPCTSVTGGTRYVGYGGIYPQATPLQQVALALRQAPASTTSIPTPSPTTTPASTLSKMNSSSSPETEKRPPQRRKFQELPVPADGPSTVQQNLRHGSEFLKPGMSSNGLRVRKVSTMPPPKKLGQTLSNGMPPPPPRNMPPPPPKFTLPESPEKVGHENMVVKKSSAAAFSDTLTKLLEYGEEDEDAVETCEESTESNLRQTRTVKPFWAV